MIIDIQDIPIGNKVVYDKKEKLNNRISILDGLRVIAILMVMLYHYYYRFLDSHYEYSFKIPEIFKFGYLGVELFFIISGFVITLTLEKCSSFSEFLKKRLIRLMPAMIICSCITFLFVTAFDENNLFQKSKSISNLLLSNTFISPTLINELFSFKLDYIDGAYWSLWAEIAFYLLAGILYFISSKNFLKNFSILVFIGVISFFVFISQRGFEILTPHIGTNFYLFFRKLFKIFTFFEYGLWFLIGMVLKHLYFNKENKFLFIYLSILFFIQTILIFNFYTCCFSFITYLILMLFIYKPNMVSFLGDKTIGKVGIASYSVYLIHENVGVFIIHKLSSLFGGINWLIPLLLLVLFSLFGLFSYKYLESPIAVKLKKIMFKKIV
ncbi:MAG TPA: acyltransferase [Flavobacterium sp.]